MNAKAMAKFGIVQGPGAGLMARPALTRLTKEQRKIADAYIEAGFNATKAAEVVGISKHTMYARLANPEIAQAVMIVRRRLTTLDACLDRAVRETDDEDPKVRLAANEQVAKLSGYLDRRIVVEDSPERDELERARLLLRAAEMTMARQGKVVPVLPPGEGEDGRGKCVEQEKRDDPPGPALGATGSGRNPDEGGVAGETREEKEGGGGRGPRFVNW